MRVVITGGTGFLGTILTRRLLTADALTGPPGTREPIDSIVLFDAVAQPDTGDERVQTVVGDIGDRTLPSDVVDHDDVAVFHLASMVSAGCEARLRPGPGGQPRTAPGRCSRPCRARAGAPPRGVHQQHRGLRRGRGGPGPLGPDTKLTPETTYGTTKAMGELLVNDYTRKGFLDGRIGPAADGRGAARRSRTRRRRRGSAACIRGAPGRRGVRGPGGPRTWPCRSAGYRTVVENLIRLHEVDGGAVGVRSGRINLPALDATPREMVGVPSSGRPTVPLGPIRCRARPGRLGVLPGVGPGTRTFRPGHGPRASPADESVDAMVAAYIQDFLGTAPVARRSVPLPGKRLSHPAGAGGGELDGVDNEPHRHQVGVGPEGKPDDRRGHAATGPACRGRAGRGVRPTGGPGRPPGWCTRGAICTSLAPG